MLLFGIRITLRITSLHCVTFWHTFIRLVASLQMRGHVVPPKRKPKPAKFMFDHHVQYKILVVDIQFLVLNTKFLVLNTQFIIFTLKRTSLRSDSQARSKGPPLSSALSEMSYLQSERDLSIAGMYIRSRKHRT